MELNHRQWLCQLNVVAAAVKQYSVQNGKGIWMTQHLKSNNTFPSLDKVFKFGFSGISSTLQWWQQSTETVSREREVLMLMTLLGCPWLCWRQWHYHWTKCISWLVVGALHCWYDTKSEKCIAFNLQKWSEVNKIRLRKILQKCNTSSKYRKFLERTKKKGFLL